MAIEARDPLGQRPCPASGSSHPKRSISLARASSSHSSLRCNTCPHPARRTYPARRPRLHGSRGAEQLDTSIPAVNSALQRARTKVDHGGQTNRRCYVNSAITRSPRSSPAGSRLGTLTTSMQSSRCSPMTCGIDAANARVVSRLGRRPGFLLRGPLQSRWRFLPTTANGQLAFGTYLWDETARGYVPGGLDILTIRNARVTEVTAF